MSSRRQPSRSFHLGPSVPHSRLRFKFAAFTVLVVSILSVFALVRDYKPRTFNVFRKRTGSEYSALIQAGCSYNVLFLQRSRGRRAPSSLHPTATTAIRELPISTAHLTDLLAMEVAILMVIIPPCRFTEGHSFERFNVRQASFLPSTWRIHCP
jgi:hypothetical protein